MQKRSRRREETEASETEEAPEAAQAPVVEGTDELLEKIDEILAEQERERVEAQRARYRAKLRTLFLRGRSFDPCRDVIEVPRGIAEALVAEGSARFYDGPPCVDC